MALSVWTQPSGYNFGTYSERTTIERPLPVTSTSGITFNLISGSLPPGLRIDEGKILGTPFEVARPTVFKFCIRASALAGVADRTFLMAIEGADAPEFQTAAGDLAAGPNNLFFVLDSSYVDFQLEATDFDTATGQKLSFFISSNNGELPPGLSLSEDGQISGFVEAAFAIKNTDGDGSYDNGIYDSVAYDFGLRPTNGYESYLYDSIIYDYNIPTNPPKKLNRNYEFIVTVTDGDTVTQRKFKIFVVADDFFRADTTLLVAGTGTFKADGTFLRAPIWKTPKYLGIHRANNYITEILDVYETEYSGIVSYSIEAESNWATNKKYYVDNKVRFSTPITGIITNTLTTTTITGLSTTVGLEKGTVIVKVGGSGAFGGLTTVLSIDNSTQITITSTIANTAGPITFSNTLGKTYICTTEHTSTSLFNYNNWQLSELPPGMEFDSSTSEIFGVVPYQPAVTNRYTFNVTAIRYSNTTETAIASRTFTIDILGEVDSVISWVSPSALGELPANYISNLKVEASTTIDSGVLVYTLESGRLPPGLTLSPDGELTGKVNQYGSEANAGLTRFYDEPPQVAEKTFTILDNGTTTVDLSYTFVVKAKDQYGYSASTREFTITVTTPNSKIYSNLSVKPFLALDQRVSFKTFVTNNLVFTPSSIYRPYDPNFGIQKELKMIAYAGIETKSAAEIASAMGLNHKKKQFKLGEVKKAYAVKSGTTDTIYEVVYLEVFDPLEPNGNRLASSVAVEYQDPYSITVDHTNSFWQPGFSYHKPTPTIDEQAKFDLLAEDRPFSQRPDNIITVDQTVIGVGSGPTRAVFPNSITNWQERISAIGETERNYLPLWMRSIQPGTKRELGFVLAVPICFCLPGTADDIILNIKYSGFNFKSLNYTVDRYIIDAVAGYSNDKYLVFKNDRNTIT